MRRLLLVLTGRDSLAWLAMLIWSALLAGSLLWNVQRERGEMLRRVTAEARANHNKDISFRRWGATHGGVYVPVTATQQPVPWLSHVKERDVITADGRRLTLLNPASMLRQMMDRHTADYGIRGRITGLKYLNPGNAPDPWERAKMLDFQKGLYQEATEVAEIGGQPYLRYLKVMTVENASCIHCHAILGFTKLGEFRGAIGVNVPLAPYLAAYVQARNALLLSHGGFWLLGLLGIAYTARRQGRMLAEHQRLQGQLLQAQKMEALGQLTGGIAHDFNNILGAVLGYTNLTLDRYRDELPAKAVDYLGEVKQAGERARDLVAKMLAYSRGSRGEAEVVEVAPVLAEAVDLLAASLPSSLEIRVQATEATPPIRIDPLRLHQVLTNLILNARDALDGQGRVAVGLCFTRGLASRCSACQADFQGDFVEIYVRDDGPGIPPEVLPRIFDPFFSTKPVGKGTGMGLAMVMGILREAGAHVLVETAPGQGTTFRLLFPPVQGKGALPTRPTH